MQQILKKGTKIPPNKRIYFKKCCTCGCKFTYQEKDMFWYDYVICPQCGYTNFIIIKRRLRKERMI